MIALVLGAGWATLTLVAAARFRPPPRRARVLVSRPAAAAGRTGPPDPLAAVGRAVLGVARRRWPQLASDAAGQARAARVAGATTLVLAGSLVAAPLLAPAVALAGWAVPRHRARAAERRRLQALEAALPEVVDLLVLAVEAGCNVPLAVAAAGRRAAGPLAAELRRVSAAVARGRRMADVLDDLPGVAGEPTRPLAALLAGCERYGTPVLPALHRLADEVRVQRQRRAEAAARRVPVLLLFPLVLCVLPAFALLTVAPLIAGALRELRP